VGVEDEQRRAPQLLEVGTRRRREEEETLRGCGKWKTNAPVVVISSLSRLPEMNRRFVSTPPNQPTHHVVEFSQTKLSTKKIENK
jgi:hypothetical protein